MTQKDTRADIITAADDLFYRRGFVETSFADIAAAVGIARGNFYYHFKSKDAILDAVLEKRLQDRQMWLAGWEDSHRDPVGRIKNFINILVMNQDKIIRFGCPLGSLSMELSKLDHPALGRSTALFTLFRDWLKVQFQALGFGEGADPLAMQLLADSQGIAVLGNAFKDAGYMNDKVDELNAWLDGLLADLEKKGR